MLLNNKNIFILLFIYLLTILSFAQDHVEHTEDANHTEKEKHDNHEEEKHEGDDHDDHDEHKEEKHGDEDSHKDEDEHVDVAKLTDEEIVEFGVKLETAAGGDINSQIELNGEVAINQENVTHVSARFGGEIKQVFVKHGDYVQSGNVLAVVENSGNLTKYSVKASRSGYITYKHASIGEVVEPSEPLFMLASFSTVWVNLNVYQKDMHKVKKGQVVKIIDPFSKNSTSAKINYIAPTMDETSRTVNVRVTIVNKNGNWRPGTFVTGIVSIASNHVKIKVPQEAVHFYEGSKVVFIQDEDGFEPKAVTLGKSNDEYVEVLSGIEVGDTYVSKNGFIIKSQLGKSEMSSGHNH